MAFMSKKKRYKFGVQCGLEELTEVPYVSAVLFAKVRLLDGGNFQDHSTREEVKNHAVQWNAVFSFVVKMCANANTGVLEPAMLRVSVRKEVKGGRSYQKLGFCDVNLAELAGSHESTRRCLLEGYDSRRRPDNSVLRLTIKMNMISGDPLFKVPGAESTEEREGAAGEVPSDDDPASTPNSGFGSLSHRHKHEAPALVTSSEMSSPEPPDPPHEHIGPPVSNTCASCIQQQPHTHSRNSSNTSGDMSSKASGYGSSVSAHSRHSSDGDSSDLQRHHHTSAPAPAPASPAPPAPASPAPAPAPGPASPASSEYLTPDSTLQSPLERSFAMASYCEVKRRSAAALLAASVAPLGGFALLKQRSLSTLPARRSQPPDLFSNFPFLTPLATRKSSLATARLSGCLEDDSPAPPAAPAAPAPALPAARNPSSGSLTASASESGSLERARPRDRRRQDDDVVVSCRVENTRVNPGSLIEELLAGAEAAAAAAAGRGASGGEGAGLRLYIARDGTAELGPRPSALRPLPATCVQLRPNDSR